MRKIFLFMMVSLDGYFEGPNHDLSWHHTDEEFMRFAVEQLDDNVDTLLFGHRTYDMMKEYWTSPEGQEDSETAEQMNRLAKLVVSHDLAKADWQNTTVVNDVNKLKEIKAQPGQDIALLGSNNLMVSLAEAGLVDEFRIMINPLAIGKGTALFEGLTKKLDFELLANRQFKNGNVLLTYAPKN